MSLYFSFEGNPKVAKIYECQCRREGEAPGITDVSKNCPECKGTGIVKLDGEAHALQYTASNIYRCFERTGLLEWFKDGSGNIVVIPATWQSYDMLGRAARGYSDERLLNLRHLVLEAIAYGAKEVVGA